MAISSCGSPRKSSRGVWLGLLGCRRSESCLSSPLPPLPPSLSCFLLIPSRTYHASTPPHHGSSSPLKRRLIAIDSCYHYVVFPYMLSLAFGYSSLSLSSSHPPISASSLVTIYTWPPSHPPTHHPSIRSRIHAPNASAIPFISPVYTSSHSLSLSPILQLCTIILYSLFTVPYSPFNGFT